MSDILNIAGRIHSISEEGIVTTASEIKDEGVNKRQSTINAEVQSELGNQSAAIDALENQNYVNISATNSDTTIEDVFTRHGITPSADTIYRVANWKYDATTKYNTSYFSEYSVNISGSTVTYVPLMVVNLGIDSVPTAGSDNLVKSGGVYEQLSRLTGAEDTIPQTGRTGYFIITNIAVGETIDLTETYSSSYPDLKYYIYPCTPGDHVVINGTGTSAAHLWCWCDSEYKKLSSSGNNVTGENLYLTVPEGAAYIIINDRTGEGTQKYIITGEISCVIYDISSANNTSYASLIDAIGVAGANIPAEARKGGMVIRYINSLTTKYLQYRYVGVNTTDADITNIDNWQGVDEEPVPFSHNLVESGGVAKMFRNIEVSDTVSDADEIVIKDASDNTIVTITEEGVDASAMTVNGVPVATQEDIAGKQDAIENVSEEETEQGDSSVIISDEENNPVVIVDKNGLKYDLVGKKIALFGDSIMEFRDANNKGVAEYIKELTGATVYRCAVHGLMLARRSAILTPVAEATEKAQFLNYLDFGHSFSKIATPLATRDLTDINAAWEKLKTDFDDYKGADVAISMNNWNNLDFNNIDIVIMSAGTNDSRYVALGDADAVSENTINGSVNLLVEALLTNFPHISLYMYTPIVRTIGENETWCDDYIADGPGMNGLKPEQLYMGIYDAAKRNHIPVKDMYNGMGWTRYNFSLYCSDGTHPRNGFKNMAEAMVSFIISNKTFK